MKVLVSGGTGLVGRYVVEVLVAAGHAVTLGRRHLPISPLVGEMPGRAEGGNAGANAAFPPSASPLLTPLCHLTVTSPPQGGRSEGASRSIAAQTTALSLTLDPTLDQRQHFAGIDAFIHLAFDHLPGRYRGGEGDDPVRFRKLNHEGSVKLFEDAKAAGVKRCIFLSSRAVYDGVPPGTLLREDMALAPDSLYGQIKLESEQALAALSSSSFITTSLRATGVYGHHRPNKWDALFEDYCAGKPVASRAGSEVHGDDLAAAILLLLEHNPDAVNGKVFNISDIVTDTYEILSLHARASGVSHPLPAPADHSMVSIMDTTQLKTLGWQPGGRERLTGTLHALAQTAQPSSP
ncbi:NAD(P)-dependent oxidoreductase [Neorhizobium sp. JUb45]|uniref:NAD-dependent epimerase/dehydratase family protein n=1 Tax=unclassified Neorhizobium TaxID=2629175 RepID=UPI0010EEBF17|nr:NAD(P)-dependent oxidoreductase [Neorhizobium sp. JUb45]TCR06522.1 nucleoside-diphosphate-sugar epimerase [Neorhizobium sp. JUb45]